MSCKATLLWKFSTVIVIDRCCCWPQQSPGLKGHQLLCRQSVTYIYSHVHPLMSPKYDHRNKSFPFCNYKLFHMIQSWILANQALMFHSSMKPHYHFEKEKSDYKRCLWANRVHWVWTAAARKAQMFSSFLA